MKDAQYLPGGRSHKNWYYALSETTIKTRVESDASARRNGGHKRHASNIDPLQNACDMFERKARRT
eukprot:3750800-Alexandrium_andersonii.AAC.1